MSQQEPHINNIPIVHNMIFLSYLPYSNPYFYGVNPFYEFKQAPSNFYNQANICKIEQEGPTQKPNIDYKLDNQLQCKKQYQPNVFGSQKLALKREQIQKINSVQKNISIKQFNAKYFDPYQAPLIVSYNLEEYLQSKARKKANNFTQQDCLSEDQMNYAYNSSKEALNLVVIEDDNSSPFIIVKAKKPKQRSRRFQLALMRKAMKNIALKKLQGHCLTFVNPFLKPPKPKKIFKSKKKVKQLKMLMNHKQIENLGQPRLTRSQLNTIIKTNQSQNNNVSPLQKNPQIWEQCPQQYKQQFIDKYKDLMERKLPNRDIQ